MNTSSGSFNLNSNGLSISPTAILVVKYIYLQFNAHVKSITVNGTTYNATTWGTTISFKPGTYITWSALAESGYTIVDSCNPFYLNEDTTLSPTAQEQEPEEYPTLTNLEIVGCVWSGSIVSPYPYIILKAYHNGGNTRGFLGFNCDITATNNLGEPYNNPTLYTSTFWLYDHLDSTTFTCPLFYYNVDEITSINWSITITLNERRIKNFSDYPLGYTLSSSGTLTK